MQQPTIETLLGARFPELGSATLSAFLQVAEYRTVRKKHLILPFGDTQRTAFYILEGVVRGIILDDSGREHNLLLRTAGSFNISINQLMAPEPAKYAFEAISDCSLLVFPFAAFETLARDYPDMNALYIRVLKENILIIQNRIAEMATKSPEQRYLTLLAQSPELFQGAFNKHIANYLGITAVSLSRIRGRVYNRFSEAD